MGVHGGAVPLPESRLPLLKLRGGRRTAGWWVSDPSQSLGGRAAGFDLACHSLPPRGCPSTKKSLQEKNPGYGATPMVFNRYSGYFLAGASKSKKLCNIFNLSNIVLKCL